MKKVGLAFAAIVIWAPLWAQISLSGTVRSASNEPLPGATIYLPQQKVGTISDGDGQFQITEIKAGETPIEISFIGFKSLKKTLSLTENTTLLFELETEVLKTDEVIVYATRAHENTPTTFSNISKNELESRNLGQDLPILLNQTPSMVTTSDAGAGIGYTGMRIRGSDATRINVTMNGIPLNDSESHGVYWVNMPDFSSSVNNIQIQRGVGTSSNGSGSFGATVNLQTNGPAQEASVAVNSSAGSFGTLKANLSFQSGMLGDHFNFEGRVSKISSDGYIDRSASDLSSYFVTGGYYGENTLIKAVIFGGKEQTQQAWYGTPEARLKNDAQGLQDVIDWSGEYNTESQVNNLLTSGRRFNYYQYENEVDNYAQDHYQLHISQSITKQLTFTGALHYTYGRGYYEQYRTKDRFSDYNLPDFTLGDSTLTEGNFIRRRWLKNDFYGAIYSFNFIQKNLELTLGGAWNTYKGNHFGEIIWAEFASTSTLGDHYYDGSAKKTDINSFLKATVKLTTELHAFGDFQVRTVDYQAQGVDNDQSVYNVGDTYVFVNPKMGATYAPTNEMTLYASYAIGNREPIRTDFIDAPNGKTPKPENLKNLEVGVRKSGSKIAFEGNYYLMAYKNQLVLTGAVNDVGSPIRTNVDRSYRTGVELSLTLKPLKQVSWSPNITLSENKIFNFTEVAYDYGINPGDEGYSIESQFNKTDISFSPRVIAGSTLTYQQSGFKAQLLNKYVGKQYLDNTTNEDRRIDAYLTHDLLLSYSMETAQMKKLSFSLLINNLSNLKYQSNGYTWGYLYEGFRYQQNNYYPQAGINFLSGISLTF